MRPVQAVGKAHPDIKAINRWKASSHRDDVVVVEDLSMLQMAQASGLSCLRFVYVSNYQYRDEAAAVQRYYAQRAEQVYEVSEKTMESLLEKQNQVGLVGVFPLKFIELVSLSPAKYPFVVVLDRMETAGNVGTILRTADATRVPLILHVDSMVSLSHPKLVASSRGMILFQPMARTTHEEAIRILSGKGYRILLGEPEEGTPYQDMDYREPCAIVVGSERYGIHPEWFQHPHEKIFIPMEGMMQSLNVGVAASLLMYEARLHHQDK